MCNRTIMLALTVLLFSSACYQYFPVENADPLPEAGKPVKAQFESPISLDIGGVTVHDVTSIEGHVFRSYADTLAVFSSALRTAYGAEHLTQGALFYFRRDQFRQLAERRIVPVKTAIAAGVTVAAVLVAYEVALRGAGGANPDGRRVEDQTHIIAPLPVNVIIRR